MPYFTLTFKPSGNEVPPPKNVAGKGNGLTEPACLDELAAGSTKLGRKPSQQIPWSILPMCERGFKTQIEGDHLLWG
jgi:hypothetical protein